MIARSLIGAPAVRKRRRLVLTHSHASAALLLSVLVLWTAAARFDSSPRLSLTFKPLLLVAAALALLGALVPWLTPRIPTRVQRSGVWLALALAIVPASATLSAIGFTGLVACNLLLVGAILIEQSNRPRVLAWLWGTTAAGFGLALVHLLRPFV